MKRLAATLPVLLLLALACTSAHTPPKETPAATLPLTGSAEVGGFVQAKDGTTPRRHHYPARRGEKRKSGVFLTTLGVGDDNYRDTVLETLADKGNGNYSYLDSMDEAKKVFERELTGTLVTIAKDVKVQIAFDPNRVASYRQLGYEDRVLQNRDFTDDTKDAGELGAGHSVTALYEIAPVANAPHGKLASVKLRYKEPKGETSKLVASSAIDTGTSAYAASADMQFAAAIAEFAMLLRKSPHKGTSSFADVAALARASHGVDLDGTREEMLRLVETSRALSGEGGTIARK